MRRLLAAPLLLLVAFPAAWGRVLPLPSTSPGQLCRQAIRAAEQAHAIPAGLLAAMGRVESGRPDPKTGAGLPWPWTVDVEGQGAYFDTEAEAIAAVRAGRARGARSIDVGCMQVNLLHHPNAFASLTQAFDPASNADYAAGFLHNLFTQTGSWPQAAAKYHSATAELGQAYRRQVMAIWPEEARLAGLVPNGPVAGAASLASGSAPRGGPSWNAARPRAGFLPMRRGTLVRIPPGWHLSMHVAPRAERLRQPACPFAALVGCARIYRRAVR